MLKDGIFVLAASWCAGSEVEEWSWEKLLGFHSERCCRHLLEADIRAFGYSNCELCAQQAIGRCVAVRFPPCANQRGWEGEKKGEGGNGCWPEQWRPDCVQRLKWPA